MRVVPLVALALLLSACAEDARVIQHREDGPAPLFLASGQSNMVGVRAGGDSPLPAGMAGDGPDAQMWKDGAFVPLTEPVFGGGGVSLVTTFALSFPGPVRIVPAAKSGSLLARWEPGGDLHGLAVNRTLRALGACTGCYFAGILWQHGEADSRDRADAETYEARLRDTLTDFQSDLGGGRVILGSIARELPHAYANAVRVAQHNLQDVVTLIDADGLGTLEDGIHFTAAARRELGQRYYDGWVQ